MVILICSRSGETLALGSVFLVVHTVLDQDPKRLLVVMLLDCICCIDTVLATLPASVRDLWEVYFALIINYSMIASYGGPANFASRLHSTASAWNASGDLEFLNDWFV
jgi:hypothetical protein